MTESAGKGRSKRARLRRPRASRPPARHAPALCAWAARLRAGLTCMRALRPRARLTRGRPRAAPAARATNAARRVRAVRQRACARPVARARAAHPGCLSCGRAPPASARRSPVRARTRRCARAAPARAPFVWARAAGVCAARLRSHPPRSRMPRCGELLHELPRPGHLAGRHADVHHAVVGRCVDLRGERSGRRHVASYSSTGAPTRDFGPQPIPAVRSSKGEMETPPWITQERGTPNRGHAAARQHWRGRRREEGAGRRPADAQCRRRRPANREAEVRQTQAA